MPTLQYICASPLDEASESFIRSAIERSYRTRRIELSNETLAVEFDEPVRDADFAEVMSRLLYICRSLNRDCLFENSVRQSYAENPMPALSRRGDVMKLADGLYAFQGAFLQVFRALQRQVEQLAASYAAQEQEFPPLWPVDLYRRIDYFKEFPQQVILCTTVHDSHAARQRFARRYDQNNDYDAVNLQDDLQGCRFGLQSAVCDACYYLLRGNTVDTNRVYTTINKVFRNETSKTDSLDRLTAFTVRDIMFVGDELFVTSTRARLVDDLAEWLKALNLNCRIETANDPFFTNEAAVKNVFQNIARSKHELLATLNYCGDALAVGSINLHFDFFGDAFDVRLPDGLPVHSGCIGIGFERLTYALFCQYGPEVGRWPESLRAFLELTQ